MALRDGIVAVKCCRKFVKFLLEALAIHLQQVEIDVEQGALPPVAWLDQSTTREQPAVQRSPRKRPWATWLHDLLLPHVTRVVVCDPRRNSLLRGGNHNDRVDARKLAELLCLDELNSVYHGEHGLRTLKDWDAATSPSPAI
jgi:hypothetical protein